LETLKSKTPLYIHSATRNSVGVDAKSNMDGAIEKEQHIKAIQEGKDMLYCASKYFLDRNKPLANSSLEFKDHLYGAIRNEEEIKKTIFELSLSYPDLIGDKNEREYFRELKDFIEKKKGTFNTKYENFLINTSGTKLDFFEKNYKDMKNINPICLTTNVLLNEINFSEKFKKKEANFTIKSDSISVEGLVNKNEVRKLKDV
jgi:hypothetical protein